MITTSIYYYKVPEATLSALEGVSYLCSTITQEIGTVTAILIYKWENWGSEKLTVSRS